MVASPRSLAEAIAVERDPSMSALAAGRANVRIAHESYGAGVYEAVVSTLMSDGAG